MNLRLYMHEPTTQCTRDYAQGICMTRTAKYS